MQQRVALIDMQSMHINEPFAHAGLKFMPEHITLQPKS